MHKVDSGNLNSREMIKTEDKITILRDYNYYSYIIYFMFNKFPLNTLFVCFILQGVGWLIDFEAWAGFGYTYQLM